MSVPRHTSRSTEQQGSGGCDSGDCFVVLVIVVVVVVYCAGKVSYRGDVLVVVAIMVMTTLVVPLVVYLTAVVAMAVTIVVCGDRSWKTAALATASQVS